MKTCLVAASVSLGAALAAFGANFPLGTYVYTGSVMNYRHEVLTSADGVSVQAVATNGTVLATCKVTDPVVSTGVNFVLEVPVASEASGKSAAIGDELNCVVVSASGSASVSPQPLPVVARASNVTNVNIVSASATSFEKDGKTVLVSDKYLSMIAPLMRYEGRSAYDPFADWDGDGASNYAEYLAGTNPFDESDRLRIRAFELGRTATLLTFEYAGGHLYAVDSSPTLTDPAWAKEPFKVGSADVAEQKTVSMEGNEYEDVGVMTLYLAPASDSPSMFYSLRAE
jgi:hypothetical protein